MGKRIFQFNGFSVSHGNSSMPVGTDSIILSGWADLENSRRILDVGTGCGVIALCAALRTSEETKIDAIELDEQSGKEASGNFMDSKFHSRLRLISQDFKDYRTDDLYDLILSNPPYFEQGPPSPYSSRAGARHQDLLTPFQLLAHAETLLTEEGRVVMILPSTYESALLTFCEDESLWNLRKIAHFHSRENKPAKRILLEFCKREGSLQEETIIHYREDGKWHPSYRNYTENLHHPGFIDHYI